MLFVLVVMVLAVIGLVSLFGGTAAAGLAALVALPILALKLALLFLVVGFFMRGCRPGWKHPHRDGEFRPRWSRPERPRRSRRRPEEPRRSDEDRFEEWHRMSHAREEVDSWVDGLPEDGPQ